MQAIGYKEIVSALQRRYFHGARSGIDQAEFQDATPNGSGHGFGTMQADKVV